MAKVEIKLNSEGIKNLLKSDEMMEVCKKHTDAAVQKLGSKYKSDVRKGKNRAVAEIKTRNKKAIKECLEDNAMLKALKG